MILKYSKLSSIIVANDAVFAQMMTLMLERLGFDRIEVVPDLARLRERQTYERHDLIVADGELTSDDCSDVLLSARTDPLLPPASFVVVSRDTSRRFRERCRRRGADALIRKPVSLIELADAIAGLVTDRRDWRSADRLAHDRM
jgi:CheY-like chemotaxis protein